MARSKHFEDPLVVDQIFNFFSDHPQVMYLYQARLIRWIDADTGDFEIDRGFKQEDQAGQHILKIRLRLARADAWECRGPEKKLGDYAEKRLNEVIPPGKNVIVLTEKDRRGHFDRYLAHIYDPDDNIIVCAWLIDNELATEYRRGGKKKRKPWIKKLIKRFFLK